MKLHPLCKQLVAGGALALLASAAHADLYNFVLTGPDTGSWQLDSSPQPGSFITGNQFTLYGYGTVKGVTGEIEMAFYNLAAGGGFYAKNVNADVGPNVAGPQLYTGSEASPTFKLGSFTLDSVYTLTISAAPVPEPASLALLMSGLGLVGFTASRRRAKN